MRRIGETAAAIVAAKPDALVIIDSPDFTHRVARRVRARAAGSADRRLCLALGLGLAAGARARHAGLCRPCAGAAAVRAWAHARLGGPPCTYVGHPLIERLAEFAAERRRRRRARLRRPPIVLVLPGSRAHGDPAAAAVFGEAVALVDAPARPIEPSCRRCRTGSSRRSSRSARAIGRSCRAIVVERGGEARGLSPRARRARRFRHRDARAGARRRADGRGLQGRRCSKTHRARSITVPSVILPNLILGERRCRSSCRTNARPAALAARARRAHRAIRRERRRAARGFHAARRPDAA